MTSTRFAKSFFPLACLVLAFGTLALYWPATNYPFINFDDDDYVTDNAVVKAGVTWDGIVWAFNGVHAANWHPLTWISHMLDGQLFGLDAGGHHLTNILFHITNALLLFMLLRYTTGAPWRSLVVAALFAWHPLRVESVVWISERKDVLCAFFWLLTLLAYARYAKGGPVENAASESKATQHPALFYTLALLFCVPSSTLSSALPVPLIVALPVSVRFSTLATSVTVTELLMVSTPSPAFSVITSPVLSMI